MKILSFEGEVDPFQFTVLSTGPLGFFRKAWRNNLRYIQGFVVDKGELLQQLIESPMSGTSLGQLASLSVSYQGLEIFSLRALRQGRTSPHRSPCVRCTALPSRHRLTPWNSLSVSDVCRAVGGRWW